MPQLMAKSAAMVRAISQGKIHLSNRPCLSCSRTTGLFLETLKLKSLSAKTNQL
jgi:ribosomal protein L32